jgi:hypothetical protein
MLRCLQSSHCCRFQVEIGQTLQREQQQPRAGLLQLP